MARPQRKAAAEAKARIHCAAAGGTPKRRCSKSPRAADAPPAPADDEERRAPGRERVRSAPGGPDAPEPAQVRPLTAPVQALRPRTCECWAIPSRSASADLSGVGDAARRQDPARGRRRGSWKTRVCRAGRKTATRRPGPAP